MFTSTQECPHCGGSLNVEHFAREDLVKHQVTLLHCEFCGLGWETLWRRRGESLEEQVSLEFSVHRDPVEFGKFLQRLHDRRAA